MRFGPFEIERPLGRGGMAETFVARYRTTQGFERTVCLKRILAEHAASPDFVAAFQEEAKLAMRLVHPHIAQVYDFGEVEGAWWMSLELIGGGDLRTFLKELGQPLPLDLGLLLAIDLAAALDYAHELVVEGRAANLVHRDVSPSNVLIDEQGNFKLVDFGIAKSSLSSSSDTTTGKVKGKASYMAPEQGLGRKLDRRADLWALGVVLFEALAGVRPFEAATDLATILRVTQGDRKTLKEVAPHVPDDVCAIVERLLTVDEAARYQTASQVIEALEHRPPPTTARRRLAQILRKIQTGEARSEMPAPTSPESTLAITSLALGATAEEPVPAAPDDVTRTRTLFDTSLEQAIANGAFEPTMRHDTLGSDTLGSDTLGSDTLGSDTLGSDASEAAAPRVWVSPELTPQRLEQTETRPAFARRGGWGLAIAAVLVAGVAFGAILAAFALFATPGPPSSGVAELPADASVSRLATTAATLDAGVATPGLAATSVGEPLNVTASMDAPDAALPSATASLDAPDAASPDAPVSDAGSPAVVAAAPSPDTTTGRRAPREGRIEVVVVPWGRVEIDGVDVGRSPYRGRLAVGPHRIDGVAGEARRTRTVRVTGEAPTRVSFSFE